MQFRCLKNFQGRELRGNNVKQVEFKVIYVGSFGLIYLILKQLEKSGSVIVEVQFGQFFWDFFGEYVLIYGRVECEFSYDGGLLLIFLEFVLQVFIIFLDFYQIFFSVYIYVLS